MKIVAEIGLAHDGSLGNALAFVDACANAGVDAVKFQCHSGDPVSKFRQGTHFPQDDTRQDYWQRTDFLIDQWQQIKNQCKSRGIEFGLSVFSELAVRTLNCHSFYPDFWKLGSGVSSSQEIIKAIGSHDVVASFGMSSRLESAIGLVYYDPKRTTVLSCVSEYPCPPEHCGVDALDAINLRIKGYSIGISDHSGTIWPSIVAASERADMAEVHVCWNRQCFGADVAASITIDELKQLVEGVRFVERMKPVDKDKMAEELKPMREIFCQ